jgi:YidC/Oxa1 family membrane protein insertase
MDRNTILGLGLIGAILVTFTLINKPTEPTKEELAKQKKEIKAAIKDAKDKDTSKVVAKVDEKTAKILVPKLDKNKVQIKDAKGALVFTNTITKKDTSIAEVVKEVTPTTGVVKGEIIRLETDKLAFDFSTKGGILAAVYLKEYQSYTDFASKSKKWIPLKLFGENDAVNELSFPLEGKQFSTGNQLFSVVDSSKNGITFELKTEENQSIQFVYSLKPKAYDMDFEVKLKGFAGKVNPKNVMLNWNADLKKSERLLNAQRLVSTVCFKYKNEDHDWLSEATDDEEKMEQTVEWIAFKQSYFSSIMKPVAGFDKAGSSLKIKKFSETEDRNHSHIKRYEASMNLAFANTGDASAKINWFFGPNDYEVLKSYNSNYEDIINYGWGLFRWINIYAIQPLFNLLAGSGLGFGIVILLVTLIIKLFLMPIQWKMYVSSAKMRILKPEIDELNAKFPNKEDAMKKQMEMMSLYRTSGASPLAGCVPMLIQMPILLAVFRFFPAAFELRQKPFLWAEDLSSYDSVYDFGTYLPLYGDHISLFTLLMAVTTLVYTYVNSGNMQQPTQPGMPNMKVIMYIFPFMMIFFFNNYSSGLSYYYFISTLISILIMLAIKQFFVDEDKLKEKMAAKKAAASTGTSTVKKKSKFQERLEQMQKAQQEAQKKKK